jgi:DNA-binding response OmpR family regulator
VVEDDADIRSVIRTALEDEGFAVEIATDGLNALQKVRQSPPDLVVLDLNMPRMGGEDFLYAWRMGGETKGGPVVVITAASQALRPADLGVEGFFSKPFDIDELLWHIKDLLAMPAKVRAGEGRDHRLVEMMGVVDDLGKVMSTLLIGVESLAQVPGMSDDLRTVADVSVDAAHRASVLARRLNHLVNGLK